MVAGERRRPATSSTNKSVITTSLDRTADTALPYTPDGGRPTARCGQPSVCPAHAWRGETTGTRPQRAFPARRRKRSHPREAVGKVGAVVVWRWISTTVAGRLLDGSAQIRHARLTL